MSRTLHHSSVIGQTIRTARLAAGMEMQSQLALKLGVSQQTVSRWEANTRTPTVGQIRSLEEVLHLETGSLGSEMRMTTSYDQPFQLEALLSQSFERFCAQLLTSHFAGTANVSLMGSNGHAQGGVDILATDILTGKTTSFQCKKVKEFGPSKVQKAVREHTEVTDKQVILLSRVASPEARKMARKLGWELWDNEDISRLIRRLAIQEQIDLVDVYFPGQRLALLGVDEPGPWQRFEEFFPQKEGNDRIFSHEWSLVGREQELESLLEAISSDAHVTLLVGAGGKGKSRLVKEVIERDIQSSLGRSVRFLSQASVVTRKDIEYIGDKKNLIVVEDAHNRFGDSATIQLLIEHALNPNNDTQLLITTRPYARDSIRECAVRSGMNPDGIAVIDVKDLTISQTEVLAIQALGAFGGNLNHAGSIAQWTVDCPLFTVIGSYVAARHGVVDFNSIKDFKDILRAKFPEVINKELFVDEDRLHANNVLRLLALVQPFEMNSRSLDALFEQVEGVNSQQSNRLMKQFVNGGIIVGRGKKYRITPDLLADLIIEDECLGPDHFSSRYAEKVLECDKGTSQNRFEKLIH